MHDRSTVRKYFKLIPHYMDKTSATAVSGRVEMPRAKVGCQDAKLIKETSG